jgi:hypothetical protein
MSFTVPLSKTIVDPGNEQPHFTSRHCGCEYFAAPSNNPLLQTRTSEISTHFLPPQALVVRSKKVWAPPCGTVLEPTEQLAQTPPVQLLGMTAPPMTVASPKSAHGSQVVLFWLMQNGHSGATICTIVSCGRSPNDGSDENSMRPRQPQGRLVNVSSSTGAPSNLAATVLLPLGATPHNVKLRQSTTPESTGKSKTLTPPGHTWPLLTPAISVELSLQNSRALGAADTCTTT